MEEVKASIWLGYKVITGDNEYVVMAHDLNHAVTLFTSHVTEEIKEIRLLDGNQIIPVVFLNSQ
jgi:hypothetical protein